MKKIILLTLFGLCCAEMIHAQSGETGSINWTLVPSGVLTLSPGGLDVIPDNFLGYTDFSSIKDNIQNVVIEEGITGIGSFAFVSTHINTIEISSSVTTIDTHAFRRCEGLTSISVNVANPVFYSEDGVLINKNNKTLIVYPAGKTGDFTVPDAVEIIGECAFWECKQLTSVFIPQSVVEIGEYAFSETGITSVTIVGSTLINIGIGAFQSCASLTQVSMPNVSVEHINNYTFSECTNLVSFAVPASVKSIGQVVFEECINLTSVTFTSSLTSIGNYAFLGCERLPSVTIPASVTLIGDGAFLHCYKLTSITVAAANTVYSSLDGVLFNKDRSTLIVFPPGKQGEYVVPESVKIIDNAAFFRCNEITSVIISSSVTNINNYAFSDCSKLASVTLPASITSIGDEAFSFCIALAKVVNLNPTPLILSPFVFSGVNHNTCKLLVPAGSVEPYKNESVWSDFIQIEVIDAQIKLDHKEILLLAGASKDLKATISGDVVSSDVVDWSSSQPTVASVDITGKVTAHITGSTVITVSAYESNDKCTVTVLQPGKSSIEGTVINSNSQNVTVNLFMKSTDDKITKGRIVGGYVLLASTIPNEDGQYSFDDLPEGHYQVQLVIEDYEPEATDEMKLPEDAALTDVNFIVESDVIIPDFPTNVVETWRAASLPELKVYPNPFTDVLRITGIVETWRAASLQYQTRHAMSLQVINAAGMIVHTQMITCPDESVHLGHLPTGMYIIRLENGGRATTVKVIKN